MALTCPNKRLKAWKDLVKVQGEDMAYYLWNEHEGIVPERLYTQRLEPKNNQERRDIIGEFLSEGKNNLNQGQSSISNLRYNTSIESVNPLYKKQIKEMQGIFGGVQIVINSTLEGAGRVVGKNTKRYNQMVEDGLIEDGQPVIEFNPEYMESDTVYHEFAHLFIDLVTNTDRAQFDTVVESLKGSDIWNEVLQEYAHLDELRFKKEVVATAIGMLGSERMSNAQQNAVQKFLNWLVNAVSNLLGLNRQALRNNIHLKGLFNQMMVDGINFEGLDTDFLDTQHQFSRLKYQSSSATFISHIIEHSNAIVLDNSLDENGKEKHDYIFTLKNGKTIKAEKSTTERIDDPAQYEDLSKKITIDKMIQEGIIENTDELLNNPELQAVYESKLEELTSEWNQKAKIGTFLHKRAEDILNNNKLDELSEELFDQTTIDTIENFDSFIRGIKTRYTGYTYERDGKKRQRYHILSEVKLYDHFNKTAGTIDLLVFDEMTGKISIYDFKSTNKDYNRSIKKIEKVTKQTRAYEIMLKNIFGVSVEDMGVFPIQYTLNKDGLVNSIGTLPSFDETSSRRRNPSLSDLGINIRTVENYSDLIKDVEDAGITLDPKTNELLEKGELEKIKESLEKTRKMLIRKLDSIEYIPGIDTPANKARKKNRDSIIELINEIDNIDQQSSVLNILSNFSDILRKVNKKINSDYFKYMYRKVEKDGKEKSEAFDLTDEQFFYRTTEALSNLELILSLGSFRDIIVGSNIISVINEKGEFELPGISSGDFFKMMNDASNYHNKIRDMQFNRIVKIGAEKTHYGTRPYKLKYEKEFFKKNPKGSIAKRKEYVRRRMAENSEEIYKAKVKAVEQRLKTIPKDISGGKDRMFDPKIAGNNIYIEMGLHLLDLADRDHQIDVIEKQKELTPLINEYIKAKARSGVNITSDNLYDEFIEKDENGNRTEFIISKYKSNAIREGREMFEQELNDFERQQRSKEIRNKYATLDPIENKYVLKDDQINQEWVNKFSENAPDSIEKRLYNKFIELLEISEQRTKYSGKSLKKRRYGQSFYMIPSVTKSNINRIVSSDAGGVLDRIKNKASDLLQKQQDDVGLEGAENVQNEYRAVKQDVYGNKLKEVPVYFRDYIGGERSKHLKQVSYDLGVSLMLNYSMASNYKKKSDVKNTLEALSYLATNEESRTIPSQGVAEKFISKTAKKLGERDLESFRETIPSSESNWYKIFEGLINDRLYGVNKIKSEFPFLGRKISAQKITDNLIGITGAIGMSFNWAASSVNVMNGVTQRLIESFGGRYMNAEDYKRGFKKYMNDGAGILSDVGRISSVSKTNLLGEIFDINHFFNGSVKDPHLNTKLKYMLSGGPGFNFMQESGEHFLQHMLMYSILNQYKIKNSKGEYIDSLGNTVDDSKKAMTLDEAFDIKVLIKRNGKEIEIDIKDKQNNDTVIKDPYLKLKSSVKQIEGFEFNDISKMSEEDFNEKVLLHIQNLIKDISFDLDGQYDTKLVSTLQRTWLGRLLMVFRRWIMRLTNNRWENITNVFKEFDELTEDEIRYNIHKESEVEGFYTSAIRYFTRSMQDLFAGEFKLMSRWKELSHVERTNIRKFNMESMVILGLLGLGWLFAKFAEGGEGDDDDSEALFYFAMLFRRTYSEYAFFLPNPTFTEQFKILKSPMASMTTIQDFTTLAKYTVSRERYKVGDRKGELKAWKRLEKLVPVYKQFSRKPQDYYDYLTSDWGGF